MVAVINNLPFIIIIITIIIINAKLFWYTVVN